MSFLDKEDLRAWLRAQTSALDAAAHGNPFNRWAWWDCWVEHIARDDWRYAVGPVAAGGGQLLTYARRGREGAMHALTNYYASLYGPVHADPPFAGTRTLLDDAGAGRPPDTFVLAPLDAGVAASLRQSFRERGWWTRRYFCHVNWSLPCAGTGFADYMAARPSSLSNTWARKLRQWRRPHLRSRLEVITQPGEVARGMQAYEAVYTRSWKSEEPAPGFVRAWAAACAERGWLRLGIAWLDEVPVAAQFWFTIERRAYIFKLAYDEAHARLSAGTVLSAELFRHALDEDGVQEIDYLTGDDEYKKSWMTVRREREGIVACNLKSLGGISRAGYEWCGETWSRWRR